MQRPFLIETMLLGSGIKNLRAVGSDAREILYYDELSCTFNISLLDYEPEKEIEESHFLERKFLKNKWARSVLEPFFRKNKFTGPGVVRAKQFWGSWSALIYARILRKNFILRCGYIWSRSVSFQHPKLKKFVISLLEVFESLIVRQADGCIYASRDIANHYNSFREKPYIVIPNGFDTSSFLPKNNIQKDYDFVYTGRLIDLKRIKEMIETLDEKYSLLVIGDGPLKSLVLNNKNIDYLGSVSNSKLPDLLNRSKFFISLSQTEGSPKCLIEGILCGLYPVVSDIPAHVDLIAELGYGKIWRPGDKFSSYHESFDISYERLSAFRKRYSMTSVTRSESEFCLRFVR